MPEWAKLGADSISVIPSRLKPLSGQFVIQISGDGLWQWRKIDPKLSSFDAFNASLRMLGYAISPAAKGRIVQCLYKAISVSKKKVCSPLLGKIDRHIKK